MMTKTRSKNVEGYGEPYPYQTSLQYLRPLQGYCDAVEKDEGQDYIVKELMGDNGLAEQSEPGKR